MTGLNTDVLGGREEQQVRLPGGSRVTSSLEHLAEGLESKRRRKGPTYQGNRTHEYTIT